MPEPTLFSQPTPRFKPEADALREFARARKAGELEAPRMDDAREVGEPQSPESVEHARPHTCPECGQKIRKLNPHRMDAAKVEVLARFGRHAAAGHGWVKFQSDPRLVVEGEPTVVTDQVHVYRLCWFALLESKERRSGYYRITAHGVGFLAGRQMVPEVIWCREGVVARRSGGLLSVSQVKDVILDKAYWDQYWRAGEGRQ